MKVAGFSAIYVVFCSFSRWMTRHLDCFFLLFYIITYSPSRCHLIIYVTSIVEKVLMNSVEFSQYKQTKATADDVPQKCCCVRRITGQLPGVHSVSRFSWVRLPPLSVAGYIYMLCKLLKRSLRFCSLKATWWDDVLIMVHPITTCIVR